MACQSGKGEREGGRVAKREGEKRKGGRGRAKLEWRKDGRKERRDRGRE